MKFLKFLTFSTILTLSAHSYATVGGGQKLKYWAISKREETLCITALRRWSRTSTTTLLLSIK